MDEASLEQQSSLEREREPSGFGASSTGFMGVAVVGSAVGSNLNEVWVRKRGGVNG